jgi:parvulin-like peptidyl-prolyl isomerase
VRTPQGYYVVKVLERAAAGPVDPLEKDKIEKELTSRKQNQLWERWVLAARGESRIDVVGRAPKRS